MYVCMKPKNCFIHFRIYLEYSKRFELINNKDFLEKKFENYQFFLKNQNNPLNKSHFALRDDTDF